MTVKEIRELTGYTQEEFSAYFGIPVRTIQNWETDSAAKRNPPDYLIRLMIYRLKIEKIIE